MSKIGDFFEDRIGQRTALRAILDHPIAGGPSWARAIGFTVGFMFVTLVVTGCALMTTYAPTIEAAWASVHYTNYIMPHGWLLRGLHRYAGEGMLVLAVVHVGMLAMGGAHRRPRELGYLAVLVLVLMTAAACITGGLLPWDQMGYWARRVELNIAGMGPGGNSIVDLVQGGAVLGQLGLTRMYTAHVVILPLVIAALLWVRMRSEGRYSTGIAARHNHGFEAYAPRQLARDLAFAVATVLVIGWVTNKMHGAPLDAPADPLSDYPARPEWYLLWMFELRHHMKGPLEFWGTAGIPLAVGGLLFLLPWLNRKSQARVSIAGILFVVVAIGVIGPLTYLEVERDHADASYKKAHAKADKRAHVAVELARQGVPPSGPLDMLKNDPDLRGEAIFTQHCASCHVLGELGDKKKANAPKLDGWGTVKWVQAQLHDPDGDEHFGRTPYKEQMPSVDVPPKDKDEGEGKFHAMSQEDMVAVATFIAAQGDQPDEAHPARDAALLVQAEPIVKQRCTACHLWQGEGDDGAQGLAPELSGYATTAWVRAQILNPATKSTYRENALDPSMKHHMPKFDGELSAHDIDLVARWTRKKARSL